MFKVVFQVYDRNVLKRNGCAFYTRGLSGQGMQGIGRPIKNDEMTDKW